MGTALFLLIVAEDTKWKKIAIVLFGLQQILNFSWSIIFFGGNNLGIASTVIVVLDLLILASIWAFAKVNRWASYLFVPYLIWCLYATYLCIGFAILN
jgi:tryptophan-rich sensory protein